jgi:hypothetical protein
LDPRTDLSENARLSRLRKAVTNGSWIDTSWALASMAQRPTGFFSTIIRQANPVAHA